MKRTKTQKGITLIALIITIVVLLILAVVAIGAVKNTGIIEHAQNATNDYEIAQEKEQIELARQEYLIAKYGANPPTSFKSYLDSINPEWYDSTNSTDSLIVMKKTGNQYEITSDGVEKILTEEEYNTKYADLINTALTYGKVENGVYTLKDEYIAKLGDNGPESGLPAEAKEFALPYGTVEIGKSNFAEDFLGVYGTFACSNNITKVVLPTTVKTVSSFEGCSSLKEIDIPSSVTSLEDFGACSSLEKINIPEGITQLTTSMFNSCSSLTSIKIPSTVTKIGDYAFSSSGLKTIYIPENVETIGTAAFSNCDNLSKVYIESTKFTDADSIGDVAFEGLAEGSIIYVRNATIASYLGNGKDEYGMEEGKYYNNRTTISTEYNWTVPNQ